MRSPTGEQHLLRLGDCTATVTEVGGGLRELRVRGRHLVLPFGDGQPRPLYRGAVLAPWPNRVADGRWLWEGASHQLPLTEPDRRTALHGLVCWSAWSVLERSESTLALGVTLWPQPGYPFLLELTVHYELAPDGLLWRLDAHNAGSWPAPYGCSVHPYLVGGPGGVDDWHLQCGARSYLRADPERLLPQGAVSVAGTPFDFRGGTDLAAVVLDHAFLDVPPDVDGLARVVVSHRSGTATVLEWDPAALPWLQLHTADRPERELNRRGLAVEPMTCAPDALNTGDGLVVLAPGERHSAWWRLTAHDR